MLRSRSVAVPAIALAIALGGATACSSSGGHPEPGGSSSGSSSDAGSAVLPVTAFQQASDPTSLIDRSASALSVVGVDGVTITDDGAALNPPDDTIDPQRATARKDGLRAELLVSNFSHSINDFSEPIAHSMLADPGHRATVVEQLATIVRDKGWNGVNVDLESLHERDTAGLVDFLHELSAALPHEATLSICLMAATNAKDYADIGYDLRGIGQAAERVMVMTYDQHGPWEDTPGPIGALSWQRAAITALGDTIPHDKLDLGVAGYAYRWGPHKNDMISVDRARKLAGDKARFDAASGEWTATLADGTVIWWSDARSFALRVSLAKRLGLHGLGLWVLGDTDKVG